MICIVFALLCLFFVFWDPQSLVHGSEREVRRKQGEKKTRRRRRQNETSFRVIRFFLLLRLSSSLEDEKSNHRTQKNQDTEKQKSKKQKTIKQTTKKEKNKLQPKARFARIQPPYELGWEDSPRRSRVSKISKKSFTVRCFLVFRDICPSWLATSSPSSSESVT